MAELKLRKNEKGMILAIDMGNTNIVIGCVDDKKVLFEERLSTDYSKTELEYAIGFKTVLEIYNINSDDIKGAIISSVVPQLVNNKSGSRKDSWNYTAYGRTWNKDRS